MKKTLVLSLLALALQLTLPSYAHAVVLPDPTGTFDGLPVAVKFDDFWSYSTQLLTQFGFAGFNGAAGVGGLDVVLLTHAGGIDNNPVSGGFVFEDPAPSTAGGCASCHTFADTWGEGDRPNGPVLVDDLLGYLHNQFGPTQNIPVFTFDLAEPGDAATRDLQLLAYFSVYDPVSHSTVASWSLDAINNHAFDSAAFITVQGQLTEVGASSTVYTADNTGSGKYDYLVFAPTMDLSAFQGHGYEFHIFSDMKDLDGAGEESFISGAIQAPPVPKPNIPEPATLLLSGLGLSLAGIVKRLRFRS